jgi:hypothetical protein
MDFSHAEPGDGSDQITPGRFRGPQSAAIAAGAVPSPDTENRARGRSTRPAGRFDSRQELAAEIASAKMLITGPSVTYFDTVRILLRTGLSPRARAEIEKFCGSLHYEPRRASDYLYRMTLNQPQPEALELIEENADHIVSRFDIAIDVPTQNSADATLLTSAIRRLAIQPRHGKRQSADVMATTAYAASRGARRNYAAYGDKPSKVTGEPCSHIEFRFNGARACQMRGVRTCGDLLSYDTARYIDRDMKLGLIDWQRAFKILRRQHPTKRPALCAAIVARTFEALATPDHRPSFDDPPRFTQIALDVVPEWRAALVSTSLNDLLYARAPVTRTRGLSDYDYDAPFSISTPKLLHHNNLSARPSPAWSTMERVRGVPVVNFMTRPCHHALNRALCQ